MSSSLPDCLPPPLPAMPSVGASAPAPAASRPPRTWYFIGTTLFALGAFAVQSLAQIATFIAVFVLSDAERTPEHLRALIHDGRALALSVIVACPLLLAALWVPIRIARQRFSDYLALRWPHRDELARGLAMLAALLAVCFLFRLLLGQPMPAFMIETYVSAKASGSLAVLLVGFCVAAPIGEELLVRGFLFSGWSQSLLGVAGAIVLSSAAWASLHTQYNWFDMSQIFALGLLLGYVRQRSGSTWLTVILHAANNLAAVAHVMLVVG
jgi:uncharacterized protein